MDRLTLSDRTVDLDSGEVSTGEHLRPMELRVLRYLASRAGAAVTLDELLGGVWRYAPGVQTRTVYSTLYRLRRAIETVPRAPTHLVTVPGSGVRLVAAERVTPVPTNLEPKRDPFVGRCAEIALLDTSASRLISVVGPSGIGKTRLVTEWASRQLSRFVGGVWLVDAADVRSGPALEERIAATLRCAPGELATVVAASGEVLLILDDLPSEIPDLAATIDRLIAASRLVVTTHGALGVAGEQRIRLGPLGTAAGLDDPAVVLLVTRLLEDDPLFRAEDHVDALVSLSRTLEGSPLALELAASHAALLGPAAALETLVASGRLETRRQDRPDHHRSTEAMIAHTWSLLPARAQRALRQLAVFDGTFPLDLGCRLLDAEPGASASRELVSELIARGLVTAVGARYRLYDLVRGFVRSLGIPPELEVRLVAHYAEVAARAFDVRSLDLPELSPEELAEWESVAYRVRGTEAWPVLVYVGLAAMAQERRTLVDAMVARLDGVELPPVVRARFQTTWACFLLELVPFPVSIPVAEEVADQLAALGEPWFEVWLRLTLAWVYTAIGRSADSGRSEARAEALLVSLPADPLLELRRRQLDLFRTTRPSPAAAEILVSLSSRFDDADAVVAKLHLVSHLLRAGATDRAERLVLELVSSALEPDCRRRALVLWAQFLARRGRGHEAMRMLEEADNVEPSRFHWGSLVEIYERRVAVRLELGDLAGAEEELSLLAGRSGSARMPRTELVLAFGAARIAACRGAEAAIPQLRSVLGFARDLGLSCAAILEWLALTHVVRGEGEAALAVVDELDPTVSLHPDEVRIQVEALRSLGRHADAARLLATFSPAQDGFGWVPQAEAAARSEAGRATPEVGAVDPREPWSRVWLARIALAGGDPGRASQLLDGCTHSTRPLLLGRAIDELRTR